MDPCRGEFLQAVVEGGLDARLAAFYSDDALYIDPGIPAGVRGKAELLAYFRKLLANNPRWVWTVYFDRTELLAEIVRYRAAR
ncbi:MAG TPA: nuclear transport factor 2 family protein [Steroidobacteraceae bacterium]|nr:nuclear transport factor 2 family protein [Steroidobacteraceae bacterium]